MEKFYTYQYLRRNGTPYYVGKGSKYRATVKQGRPCGIPTSKHRIIIQWWDSEPESFAMEMWWIRFWGRKDLGTGILQNKSDGGEGASNPSEEVRYRRGAGKRGKPVSEEQKRKASLSNLGKHVVSEETRRKMSESAKRQPKKTHCKRGHELISENTYVRPRTGYRMCLTCARRKKKHSLDLGGDNA